MKTNRFGGLRGIAAGIFTAALLTTVRGVAALEPGEPIQLAWSEGDVAGYNRILSEDGQKTIGFVDYRQRRVGDMLEAVRVAQFTDGSSDEDQAEARIGKTLEAVRGRSIIRNTHGTATVDISIDVVGGHISGFSGLGKERQLYDEHAPLPSGTYWGPLISLVVKNFDKNAQGDRLVFRTVVATPKPRVLDMELVRKGPMTVTSPGRSLQAVSFSMLPTVNFLIDPIIKRLAPETRFFAHEGKPPAIVRFLGPRNYAGEIIRIE